VLVKAADSQPDPLSALPSFAAYTRGGVSLTLETKKFSGLGVLDREWMFDLLERNMKDMYQKADWGWNVANKRKELEEDAAWYLVARRAEDGAPVAFSHFRFDMDFDDDVLYCYEIQLEEALRGKGLGKFMMKVLELLMIKAGLFKIMLTVFKHNPKAVTFFKDGLKYGTDTTCPVDTIQEQFDYEILSRPNAKEVKRREEEAEA
jgi:GNAT superfamily N-acetyltransferase